MFDIGNTFKNKRILIYGFGKTGKSSFNFLKKNNKVVIYDDNHRTIPKRIKKIYFQKNNNVKK